MTNKRWTISLILLFFLFLYVLFHFVIATQKIERTVEQLQQTAQPTKSLPHFVLISQEFDNPYWRKVEQGAKEAAKQYDVNVEYIGPLRTNMDEQMKLLEKAIASRVDGIIVQSLNDARFTPLIDKAIARNIPVITIDTDAPKSRRLAYVGTNNFEAGQLLGKTVASRVSGNNKIGVIIGSDTSANQQLRLQGFQSIIAQHPGLSIVAVSASNISRIQASIQAEKMLRMYPDISVMVGTSALDAIGILMAMKNLDRGDVQIFGFDDVEETLEAIKQGKIVATVIQKPYDMGFSAVKLMVEHLAGKPIANEYFTATEIVDATNVEQEGTR
ncbi:sugar-binding protein [Anoxybacillus sp. J5B_2022]|uniref:sugar-binding protein n=1 Tax=Anoxybacillus sp. J5B_2022 TaxID=3003246 RepID=UPI0022857B4E|nr:sugar-binding protein [Anoxybacillus sp. J5B_2022]MCZ0754170.1 sugar-binding protein [Anoxybacillus sp. J5B_2022]